MKYNKVVDDLIIKDKDLFKEHVKRIAKSIIYELPYIRYGQAVFNYVDEYFGVARKVQFEDNVDCFYNDDAVDAFIEKTLDALGK